MDQSLFHRLFIENQRQLFGYVVAMLPRVEEAEEVFQNACVVLLGKFDDFKPGTNFLSWACQVAKFEVYKFRRKSHQRHFPLGEAELELLARRHAEMAPHLAARQRALRQCMKKLRSEDRRLIEARYGGTAENSRALAKSLQMVENTVYKALGRIRRALRYCVETAVAQEEHS